jgi:acetyl-CoA acyltransferase
LEKCPLDRGSHEQGEQRNRSNGVITMANAVIVGGIRTPFVKAGDAFNSTPAPELGRLVVREVIDRYGIEPDEIDEVICGNVASPVDAANVARVISLRAGVPRDKVAHTVSRNCASGMECVTQAIDRVNAGHAECVIAVGVDSMSNIPVFWKKRMAEKLFNLSKARSAIAKLKTLGSFRPADLAPEIGIKLGLTDPTTGMMMGDTADKLAREYQISRETQDEFALKSHQRAIAAQQTGKLDSETMTVFPAPKSNIVNHDIGPRDGQSMAALAKMKPYFDRKWGTITVGNSCQITDGAAAMLIMSESKAKDLGLDPIGRVSAYAYAGCDPERMGLGPVYSSARALKKAAKTTSDMELIELNEAFAAQVLACLKGFENPPKDCSLAASGVLGEINPQILNVNGGAIALGHPVGATGTRLILTLLHELSRRDQTVGLATLCIGGGQGGAVVVERMAKAA